MRQSFQPGEFMCLRDDKKAGEELDIMLMVITGRSFRDVGREKNLPTARIRKTFSQAVIRYMTRDLLRYLEAHDDKDNYSVVVWLRKNSIAVLSYFATLSMKSLNG